METVWITGATGTIGSALARRLDARGVNVVLSARDSGKLEALAAEPSPGALSVVADATDASSSPNVLKIAEERFGPVTGLAHCVGSILIKPLHLTTPEELDTTTTQNYLSAWHVLRAFVIAQLKHRERASAVLVGTVATRSGFASTRLLQAQKGELRLSRRAPRRRMPIETYALIACTLVSQRLPCRRNSCGQRRPLSGWQNSIRWDAWAPATTRRHLSNSCSVRTRDGSLVNKLVSTVDTERFNIR